jgi:hypothetical protein
MPKVEYKCLYCGKTFYAYESEKRKYCSLACAYKSPSRVWCKGKKGVVVSWNKGLSANPNLPNFDPRLLSIAEAAKKQNREFMEGEKNPAKRPEVRKKISESKKGDKNPSKRPDVRQKLSLKRKGWKHIKNPEEVKKKISQTLKGRKFTEEHKRKLQQRWKDVDFKNKAIETIMKSCKKKPNKVELKFEKLLNDVLPNEYRYVGNGQFFLAGKCPDFLNVNGKKKVIEVFGDYWHKGENPSELINHYRTYGFDCLIVWEHELKDLDDISKKVVQFTYS